MKNDLKSIMPKIINIQPEEFNYLDWKFSFTKGPYLQEVELDQLTDGL